MGIETIKLFKKVAFYVPFSEEKVSPDLVSALNLEVAAMGFTFGPDLIEALSALEPVAFAAERANLITDLMVVSGADKNMLRLFNDFPYSTPDQWEYMEKRVLGHIASEAGIRLGGNILTPLSCGHVIDSALFDVDKFGACPICQFQVPELGTDDVARVPFQSLTPLKVLGFSSDFFAAEASQLLARPSSLSEDEKIAIMTAAEYSHQYGSKIALPEGAIFKETLPFVYDLFGADAIKGALSGATDVMRIAYHMSDKEADLSLKDNVRFKLSTSQKRNLLVLLDGISNLAEDMMRDRERWLRLGERLNPGSKKNRARFPKAAAAFDRLRNDAKGIVTFNKQMEETMRAGQIDQDFINLMAERPGEFARKLDYMLRNAPNPTAVVEAFKRVAPNLPEKLLFELRKYLGSRDLLSRRMFFPKGQANKVQIVEDKRKPIDREDANACVRIIEYALMRRLAEKPALGNVFIDPALKDVVMPFNRRGDSSSMASDMMTKGSRFPFSGDVVRGFVWWKNGGAGSWGSSRTDVDLSVVMFDEKFTNMGHVAFTNLSDAGIIHSGDIQDAPEGASEFIDFDLTKVNKSVRYIALSVIVYTGQTFDQFECFAGFMERDSLKSGKVYEPESVKVRFDISAKTTQHMPVLFDLKERKVIFADMSMASGGRGAAVAQQSEKQAALTEGMLSLPDRKPTLYDVVLLNAKARGTLVDTPEEADTRFMIDDAPKLIAEGVE